MGVLLSDSLAAEGRVRTAIRYLPKTGVDVQALAGKNRHITKNRDRYIGAAAVIHGGWWIESPPRSAFHRLWSGASDHGRIGVDDVDQFSAERGIGAAIHRLPGQRD